jgi:hypothetical protein
MQIGQSGTFLEAFNTARAAAYDIFQVIFRKSPIDSCSNEGRVSVQGVKSLGGHFACLCWGFDFYEVKEKILLFFKKKMEILLHF